jgi:hypothetical protein
MRLASREVASLAAEVAKVLVDFLAALFESPLLLGSLATDG